MPEDGSEYSVILTYEPSEGSYTGTSWMTTNGTKKNHATIDPRLTRKATLNFMNQPIARSVGLSSIPRKVYEKGFELE